jgi:hypothetical protein
VSKKYNNKCRTKKNNFTKFYSTSFRPGASVTAATKSPLTGLPTALNIKPKNLSLHCYQMICQRCQMSRNKLTWKCFQCCQMIGLLNARKTVFCQNLFWRKKLWTPRLYNAGTSILVAILNKFDEMKIKNWIEMKWKSKIELKWNKTKK